MRQLRVIWVPCTEVETGGTLPCNNPEGVFIQFPRHHVPFPHPSRYLGMSKGRYPSIHPPAHPIPSHPIPSSSFRPVSLCVGRLERLLSSASIATCCETLRLTSRAQSKRRGTTAPDRPGLRQRATTRFCSPLRVPALLRGRVALAEPDVSLVAEPGRGR